MLQHNDQWFAYSSVLLAAAPLSTQLASSHIGWVFFFPIFAIPALTLMNSIGTLSNSATVQTFRKMVPIAGGIGWAFTWHIAEKLFIESLRAAQLFIYVIFSLRPSLSWAISCGHVYNSQYCHDFANLNTTITSKTHHYPDNFWPAQEFNRYVIRNNPAVDSMPSSWEPNMWYLGSTHETFIFTLPAFHLLAAHLLTWSLIYLTLTKYYDRLSSIIFNVFVLTPIFLYIVLVGGLTVFGFHFNSADVQQELDDKMINKDPYDFWADMRGSFRTSMSIVDYSSAFTGIVIFATSRIRSGVGSMNSFRLVAMLMIVPAVQTIIRVGCEGNVFDSQPNYKIYASTDETISFDLLPVCFATSPLGPLWASIFFAAQYLYSSLGPMIIYSSFIYQSVIDDFPTVQNQKNKWIGLMCGIISLFSVFLYMPFGTRIVAFFRYASQTSFVQLAAYVVIFFIYGWQRLEENVSLNVPDSTARPLLKYLTSPTSPIITLLLFTVVPMLLCCKFVAVFDFLASGNEVLANVDNGFQFLPFPIWIRRFIGYMMIFAPSLIILFEAGKTVHIMVFKYHLSWRDTLKPTSDWMSHVSVNTNKRHCHTLSYVIVYKILRVQSNNSVFMVLIFEAFVGIILVVLFFLNASSLLGLSSSHGGNEYRSCMLLMFATMQVYVTAGMRKSQVNNTIGEKLNPYIAVATLETAMLNAYMWMFASDHKWGLDIPPLLIMIFNTGIRGLCILTVIAARAFEREHHQLSNTREASEVDESEVQQEDDVTDDTPVIFDIYQP